MPPTHSTNDDQEIPPKSLLNGKMARSSPEYGAYTPEKGSACAHVEASEAHQIHTDSPMQDTTRLIALLSAFIGLGGFIVNFDIGYTGAVLVMSHFSAAFGSCEVEKGMQVCELSALQQSLSSSIYLLFMALGGGISGVSAKYLGTKGAVQFGCLWIIVGAAGILGTSGNLTAYIACKCIGGVGIGHVQAMSTTYGVECAPAKRRGFLITLYSTGAGLGSVVVSSICLGTVKINSSWSWKTPILLQIPLALTYGLAFFLFPESPRWLLIKGKVDRARNSFGRLYNRSADSQEVSIQIQDVQLALEEERRLSATTNWTEIFHRNFIRRTLTSLAINVGGTLSGAFFIFTYAAIFFKALGGFSSPIEISLVINCCLFAGLIVGPAFADSLGRRRTILTGYVGMMVCMIIFAGVSSGLGSKTTVARDVSVAFLCLWAFFFGGFIASNQWVTSAELHAVRLRTSGQAFNILVTDIFVFGTNFWTPYMLNVKYGDMGTNVGYFYFGCEFVAFVILFALLPETSRLTLEEIDAYFMSGRKAWKTSLARNKRIADGKIGVNDD